ncbi:hypothetical protein N7444_012003 [Penicillium canescens]|nr:hypothetical protein N7444_012003 [Penicillium canescens]
MATSMQDHWTGSISMDHIIIALNLNIYPVFLFRRAIAPSELHQPSPILELGTNTVIVVSACQKNRARNRITGDRLLPEEFHQDRNLYADGFVRHVDIREPPPLEYVSRRPGPEAKPTGDSSLPVRTRITDYPGTKPFSYAQISPDQRGPLPMGSRMAPVSHNHVRTLSESSPGKSQPHVSPSQIHRPLSGGFISSRRPPPGLPPSSLAMEQNRPVYVQRVDPRPSYYPVPDGRPIVIVD